MGRARIVCRCSTCLQVYQDGCSFSSSGYQNHIQVMRRKTAEINARDYFADDEEMDHVFAEDERIQFESHAASMEEEYAIDNMDSEIPPEIMEELDGDALDDEEIQDIQDSDREELEEEENSGKRRHQNDLFVPNHPVAFILFILVMLFYGRYVSDHGLEIMMLCFNLVLELLNIPYRFPCKVEQLKRWIVDQGETQGGIKEYVMCKTCSSIYAYHTEEERERLHRHNRCKSKDTLTHSHKCMTQLFDQVNIRNNSADHTSSTISKFVPLKRYFYNSLIHTLKSFVKKEGFTAMLKESFARNKARNASEDDFMSDVQHGDVYQGFSIRDDDVPFTKESPYNLMLLLNLDWLSPFELSSYSVGGVWLSILNLDHSERILRCNTVLSSVLPGPKEPTQIELARLLTPLVEELQLLKEGILMTDSTGEEIMVKACLCLVSADLPAIRKVLGLGAHNSLYSCGFCDHEFSSCDNNQRDYSNLDIDSYPRRTMETHRSSSALWQNAKTLSERDEIKKNTGTGYSILQELDYFNCVDFQAIDVLHCSYLGITKRIIRTIWLDLGCTVESNARTLSSNDLREMSALLKDFIFPLDLDGQSIARKLLIGDGFGYFKGSEYAAFLLISPYLLQGRLSIDKYKNFMKFVELNRLLRLPGLFRKDIDTIKQLSKEFMEEFLQLYEDPKFLSSNFHLFLHLPETIQRYSTPCNFWLFFYERLNSDIKSINTSNNSNNNIEKTFFTRFLNSIYAKDLFQKISKPIDLPDYICDELEKLFSSPDSNNAKKPAKFMEKEYAESKQAFDLMEYLGKEDLMGMAEDEGDMFVGLEILPPSTILSIRIDYDKPAKIMYYTHFTFLVGYYNATYGCHEYSTHSPVKYVGGDNGAISSFNGQIIPVSNLVRKFKSVKLFTSLYKSVEGSSSRLKRGSYVLAYCRNDPAPGPPTSCLRPGQIVYFFRNTTSVRDVSTGEMFHDQVHSLCFIRWFKVENRHFTAFTRYNMDVCRNEFEPDGVMSIVPLLRIHSPIAIKLNHFENINVYIKMPRSIF